MRLTLSILTLLTFSSFAFAQEEKTEVFRKVEVQPEFNGGMMGFYKYIMKNMRYPAFAKQNGIEGKVHVQFVIDTTGAVIAESVEVHKGVHESLDQEAVRLLKECPDWEPGRYTPGGEPAKVRMIVPITFRIGKKSRSRD